MGYYIFTRFEFVTLHSQTKDAVLAMNQGKSIFAQLMSHFPEFHFRQCVARDQGDRHKIKFSCRNQFTVMAKKEFHLECELYILAQSIGLVLFEKEPINEIFNRKSINKNVQNDGQLWLWPNFSGQ